MEQADREVQLVRGCAQLRMAWSREDSKMFAFLSIFHPEMPLEQRLELAHDVSDRPLPFISAQDFCAAMRELTHNKGSATIRARRQRRC